MEEFSPGQPVVVYLTGRDFWVEGPCWRVGSFIEEKYSSEGDLLFLVSVPGIWRRRSKWYLPKDPRLTDNYEAHCQQLGKKRVKLLRTKETSREAVFTEGQPFPVGLNNIFSAENAAEVKCLGWCGKKFFSPHKCRVRFCPRCNEMRQRRAETFAEIGLDNWWGGW